MDSDDELVPTLIDHPDGPPPTRVPLTIICGFLGAGKSTLLKRILTERHGYRIAVIMNEFGDTADIETKAVNISSAEDPTAEKSEEILELANGCLCCSIKDSGAAAIEKLMERKGAFDHIILETTGLADPGPIASMFWLNEEYAAGLGRDIALDGVICVVDAVFGKKQIDEDRQIENLGESLRQIAGADVILLNKVDLVEPGAVSLIEDMIVQINPAAPLHRTVRGEIDLRHIMGIAAYASAPNKLRVAVSTPMHGDAGHEHVGESTHYETRGISSLQVSCPVLSERQVERLDEWIRTVLWEKRLPGGIEGSELDVLRCKGVFTVETGEEYVLQGVRSMYEMTAVAGQLGVPGAGKIVLIGKGLDGGVRASLEDAIRSGDGIGCR